jgi:hypothetical protein
VASTCLIHARKEGAVVGWFAVGVKDRRWRIFVWREARSKAIKALSLSPEASVASCHSARKRSVWREFWRVVITCC